MAAEAQGTRTTVADPLKPTGFWSYTSSDDKHSDGHLSQLRRPGLAHGHRPAAKRPAVCEPGIQRAKPFGRIFSLITSPVI